VKGQRPKDEPWPGGRGVYDWTVGRFVPVLERECAGHYIERKALATPSTKKLNGNAETSALHGGK
jgi:hypothetical protein